MELSHIKSIIEESMRNNANKLAESKDRESIADICCVGALYQVEKNRNAIAQKMGLRLSVVSKLLRHWRVMIADENSVASEVMATVMAERGGIGCADGRGICRVVVRGNSIMGFSEPRPPHTEKCLGFEFSPSDVCARHEAIRDAIKYMDKFGKGYKPRINGEYFEPGKAPNDADDQWLPCDTAALYCGCRSNTIALAGKNGTIRRRPYARTSSRILYEYNLADLDEFINKEFNTSLVI